MKTRSSRYLSKFYNKKKYFPFNAQIELSYRCNLNCIHCYCKGSEDKNRELTTQDWKKILDEIQTEGCTTLTLTGGDPLLRDDFLEIYSHAKKNGFIITLFASGQEFTKEIINFLAKSPPYSIEITLNGITKDTYESITGLKGSYAKAMKAIRLLAERKLALNLKANCLKQNKHEVVKIKRFTEQLLGRPAKKKYYFKYDPLINPRLNGDRTPCSYRLSFEELLEVQRQDPDLWREYQKGLHGDLSDVKRDGNYLYHCSSWMKHFFINPYGRLKFCLYSDKFSADLKTRSFREGFYEVFPKLLDEEFKTASKCRNCSLKLICYSCPARAYSETGNEEAPVEYYCELARVTADARLQKKEQKKNRRTDTA